MILMGRRRDAMTFLVSSDGDRNKKPGTRYLDDTFSDLHKKKQKETTVLSASPYGTDSFNCLSHASSSESGITIYLFYR
jgi:hypothetical protein